MNEINIVKSEMKIKIDDFQKICAFFRSIKQKATNKNFIAAKTKIISILNSIKLFPTIAEIIVKITSNSQTISSSFFII